MHEIKLQIIDPTTDSFIPVNCTIDPTLVKIMQPFKSDSWSPTAQDQPTKHCIDLLIAVTTQWAYQSCMALPTAQEGKPTTHSTSMISYFIT